MARQARPRRANDGDSTVSITARRWRRLLRPHDFVVGRTALRCDRDLNGMASPTRRGGAEGAGAIAKQNRDAAALNRHGQIGLAIPIESPIATERTDNTPRQKFVAGPKEPVPSPRRNRDSADVSTALIRHGHVKLAIPIEIPIATKTGPNPAAKFVAGPKEPVPSPSRIETLLLLKFATARSKLAAH